ncbi:MAG TPA: DcaP family trimeric outer membrane transporter [Candidatus Binatia bacterium]|jgi:hypothetical protein
MKLTRNLRAAVGVTVIASLSCFSFGGTATAASDPQIDELKAEIRVLMQRVDQLEKEKAHPPAAAPAPTPVATPSAKAPVAVPGGGPGIATVQAPVVEGPASPIAPRDAFNDQQQAAPRPDDLTLDPKYLGFIAVPNTPVMIKFNAKPRVDATYDNKNAGDDDRFVTAKIPVTGDPAKGGDGTFNINAKGSQLRVDVRAPSVAGSPRFYYENDFFGSGGGEFNYRVRHLYGQIYNIIVGQTYSVFEDPDIWPDTLDYEGPSSAIFARRPLIRYQYRFDDQWQVNLGLEQPSSEIDTTNQNDSAASGHSQAPDGGFNVRWESASIGHVQLATMFRDLGVTGPVVGNHTAFGWGLNLTGGFNTFGRDSVQTELTYGQGIFHFVNDNFANLDAAFDRSGNLQPLPYFGVMLGYTHHWSELLRTTLSYGFTDVDNAFSQDGDAYHQAHYASVNLMWQIRKRLTVGLEELYGYKKTNDGSEGDVFRTQLGLVYSIFD